MHKFMIKGSKTHNSHTPQNVLALIAFILTSSYYIVKLETTDNETLVVFVIMRHYIVHQPFCNIIHIALK